MVGRCVRGSIAGVPPVIWLVTGLFVMGLLAFSVLLPAYQAPDEPQHTDLAHHFSEDLSYPAWNDRYLDIGIARSLGWMRFADRSRHLTADEAPPKDRMPSIEDLADPPRRAAPNYMPQHPPLYYGLAGGIGWAAERVLGDPVGSFVVENWLYRLVSVALVAPLPIIIWRTARRLRLPDSVRLAAALLPLAIPQLLHNGAAVNNDSLMWLLFWLLTPLVLRIADGDLGTATVAAAGVLTGLALLTKGFALVLPAWVIAAVVVAARRGDATDRARARRAGAQYLVVALAVGGWWWIRNLVLYQDLAPTRITAMMPSGDDAPTGIGAFVEQWLTTTSRFWGDFGWYYTRIPVVAVVAGTALLLLGLGRACVSRDTATAGRRTERLLLAAPFILLVTGQAANSLRVYLVTGRIGGMHGRYWFGGLAALLVVVAAGLATLMRRHLHLMPAAAFVAAAVMQVLAVRAILGFYWGAPGSSLADRLRALVAWAPLPGEVLAAGAVVGAAAAVAVAVVVARLARRGAPGGADPRSGEGGGPTAADAPPGGAGVVPSPLPAAHPV